MKFLLFLIILLSAIRLNAENLMLTGQIGTLDVELFITDNEWITGEIKGKYRYLTKNKFLKLSGQIQGNCFYIIESNEGQTTGEFYLTKSGDSLTGKWLSTTNYLDVRLVIVKGDKSLLKMKELKDFRSEVSDKCNGTYQNETYFLNDMYLSDDNLEMEIAFNGGKAVIEQISKDSIRFFVQVVCGPTYHIGVATGIAVKNQDNSHYKCIINDFNDQTPCIIILSLGDKEVRLDANEGFACGFGVRAYLSHTFLKVTDDLEYDEEEGF